jgi:hypothetical protein
MPYEKMTRHLDLPSIITADSISDWLSLVNFIETIPASNELLSALNILSKVHGTDHDLLAGLKVIAPLVHQNSDKLILLLAQSAPDPSHLSSKSRKIARLNGMLIRALCLAYINVLGQKSMPEQEKIETLAKILRLVTESIKANSLYYNRGSTTLWKKMGGLYELAIRENILDKAVTEHSRDTSKNTTLISLFKQSLILDLLNAYQTPYNKRTALFDFAGKCADKLDISEQGSTHHSFIWDTRTELPVLSCQAETSDSNLVYINTDRLTRYLKKIHPELTGRESWFFPNWQKLNGYSEILDSLTPSMPRYFEVVVGMEACLELVKQLTKLSNLKRFSALPEQSKNLNDIELEPLKDINTGHIDLSGSGLSSTIERANIQPARFENFCSAQIRHASIRPNTLVLILSNQKPPDLGIVRAQQANPNDAVGWALLEKLPGNLRTVVIRYNEKISRGLLLRRVNGALSILLPAARYSSGDKLEITGDTPRFLTLERLEETNDQFICFQASVD